MVVKLQLTLASMSPHFIFVLYAILLAIAYLFGLTVSQQFLVSVHKSSTNSVDKEEEEEKEEEKKEKKKKEKKRGEEE